MSGRIPFDPFCMNGPALLRLLSRTCEVHSEMPYNSHTHSATAHNNAILYYLNTPFLAYPLAL